jgi:hypothetical protein
LFSIGVERNAVRSAEMPIAYVTVELADGERDATPDSVNAGFRSTWPGK